MGGAVFFRSLWNWTRHWHWTVLKVWTWHIHMRVSRNPFLYISMEWMKVNHKSNTHQKRYCVDSLTAQMGKHLICAWSVSLLLWWQHAKTGNMRTWTWLTEKRKQRCLNTDRYPGEVSRNISNSLANVSVWREHILWVDRMTCRLLPGLRLRVRDPGERGPLVNSLLSTD